MFLQHVHMRSHYRILLCWEVDHVSIQSHYHQTYFHLMIDNSMSLQGTKRKTRCRLKKAKNTHLPFNNARHDFIMSQNYCNTKINYYRLVLPLPGHVIWQSSHLFKAFLHKDMYSICMGFPHTVMYAIASTAVASPSAYQSIREENTRFSCCEKSWPFKNIRPTPGIDQECHKENNLKLPHCT